MLKKNQQYLLKKDKLLKIEKCVFSEKVLFKGFNNDKIIMEVVYEKWGNKEHFITN